MFRLFIRSKSSLFLILSIHITLLIASELTSTQVIKSPSQSLVINGRDVIGELFADDNTISYDAVLMFLEELENGDLEKVCSEEDLYKINYFFIFS